MFGIPRSGEYQSPESSRKRKVHKGDMALALMCATLSAGAATLAYQASGVEIPFDVRSIAVTAHSFASVLISASGIYFANRALRDI